MFFFFNKFQLGQKPPLPPPKQKGAQQSKNNFQLKKLIEFSTIEDFVKIKKLKN